MLLMLTGFGSGAVPEACLLLILTIPQTLSELPMQSLLKQFASSFLNLGSNELLCFRREGWVSLYVCCTLVLGLGRFLLLSV